MAFNDRETFDPLKIALVCNVRGRLCELNSLLSSRCKAYHERRKSGPHFVLCFGDFCGADTHFGLDELRDEERWSNSCHENDDALAFWRGRKDFPLRVYFIDSSQSRLGASLRSQRKSHAFSSTLIYLGGVGVVRIQTLYVGFLSGLYDAAKFTEPAAIKEGLEQLSDDNEKADRCRAETQAAHVDNWCKGSSNGRSSVSVLAAGGDQPTMDALNQQEYEKDSIDFDDTAAAAQAPTVTDSAREAARHQVVEASAAATRDNTIVAGAENNSSGKRLSPKLSTLLEELQKSSDSDFDYLGLPKSADPPHEEDPEEYNEEDLQLVEPGGRMESNIHRTPSSSASEPVASGATMRPSQTGDAAGVAGTPPNLLSSLASRQRVGDAAHLAAVAAATDYSVTDYSTTGYSASEYFGGEAKMYYTCKLFNDVFPEFQNKATQSPLRADIVIACELPQGLPAFEPRASSSSCDAEGQVRRENGSTTGCHFSPLVAGIVEAWRPRHVAVPSDELRQLSESFFHVYCLPPMPSVFVLAVSPLCAVAALRQCGLGHRELLPQYDSLPPPMKRRCVDPSHHSPVYVREKLGQLIASLSSDCRCNSQLPPSVVGSPSNSLDGPASSSALALSSAEQLFDHSNNAFFDSNNSAHAASPYSAVSGSPQMKSAESPIALCGRPTVIPVLCYNLTTASMCSGGMPAVDPEVYGQSLYWEDIRAWGHKLLAEGHKFHDVRHQIAQVIDRDWPVFNENAPVVVKNVLVREPNTPSATAALLELSQFLATAGQRLTIRAMARSKAAFRRRVIPTTRTGATTMIQLSCQLHQQRDSHHQSTPELSSESVTILLVSPSLASPWARASAKAMLAQQSEWHRLVTLHYPLWPLSPTCEILAMEAQYLFRSSAHVLEALGGGPLASHSSADSTSLLVSTAIDLNTSPQPQQQHMPTTRSGISPLLQQFEEATPATVEEHESLGAVTNLLRIGLRCFLLALNVRCGACKSRVGIRVSKGSVLVQCFKRTAVSCGGSTPALPFAYCLLGALGQPKAFECLRRFLIPTVTSQQHRGLEGKHLCVIRHVNELISLLSVSGGRYEPLSPYASKSASFKTQEADEDRTAAAAATGLFLTTTSASDTAYAGTDEAPLSAR